MLLEQQQKKADFKHPVDIAGRDFTYWGKLQQLNSRRLRACKNKYDLIEHNYLFIQRAMNEDGSRQHDVSAFCPQVAGHGQPTKLPERRAEEDLRGVNIKSTGKGAAKASDILAELHVAKEFTQPRQLRREMTYEEVTLWLVYFSFERPAGRSDEKST